MVRRVKFIPHWSQSDEAWFVSIPPNLSKTGKRSRLFFKSKDDALRAADRLKDRHQNFGTSLASLDPVRLGEAAEAFKRLDALKRPYSLLSIVQGWIERTQAKASSVSLLEAFDRYVQAKGHLSPVHKQQILSVKARFEKTGPIGPISEIQPEQIESALSSLAAGSRNRYMRILRAVWNYAIRKDWTKDNPIDRLDFAVLPKKPIQIFSNEQIQSMLDISLESYLSLANYTSFVGLTSPLPKSKSRFEQRLARLAALDSFLYQTV